MFRRSTGGADWRLLASAFVIWIGGVNAQSDPHEALMLADRYPPATDCAVCHPRQYRQWSVSQHAYAQLSPVFMAMSNTIHLKTSATNGDFCLRCHTPVGTDISEPLALTNLDRNAASREGVTCVACHRVSQAYGKISGRLALTEGDLVSPVKGPSGNEGLAAVLEDKSSYRNLSTDRDNNRGKKVHAEVEPFFELVTPRFCGSCHDVLLVNGFRLEEAFSDYKTSPAFERGATCQDCHMGQTQGLDQGYEHGPAAVIGRAETPERRLTNHYFAGPDYSIVHPGIFPHQADPPRNLRSKSLRDWIQFDYLAGWGDNDFEKNTDDMEFPEAWKTTSHRKAARKLIIEQCELLDWARGERVEVLRHGYQIGDVEMAMDDSEIRLSVPLQSNTDGHNVPTGFDAERLVFLEVIVDDANGRRLFVSGDRDPNGDVRDLHSLYVVDGAVELDRHLVNLQSKFLTRLVRGGEREQVLAINTSVNARPFIRPEMRPTTLYGQPAGARKHRTVLSTGEQVEGDYPIELDATVAWPLSVSIRLIGQMVPVNLVAEVAAAGFDYQMSPAEVARRVVEGAEVIRSRQLMLSEDGTMTVMSGDPEPELCDADGFDDGNCHFSNNMCRLLR